MSASEIASVGALLASDGGVAITDGDVSTFGTGAVARRLPGARMRTIDGLFTAFADAWGFPAHFGRNKDAFDDAMGDLPVGAATATGSRASAYLIVVDDAEDLLVDAGDDLVWFADSIGFWREVNRERDVDLAVVLRTSRAAVDAVADRWRAAGAPPARLRQN